MRPNVANRASDRRRELLLRKVIPLTLAVALVMAAVLDHVVLGPRAGGNPSGPTGSASRTGSSRGIQQ